MTAPHRGAVRAVRGARRALGVALLGAGLVGTLPNQVLGQEDPPTGQQGEEGTLVEEVVTVTATRLPTATEDLSTSTRVIPAGQLRLRPGLGLDEALAWEPGFSLFRRTPSRAAHPTTHGVNLRGVAPTGTSRALVLVDGAPMADAFGGWVQWERVPAGAIEQVEIAYGGGSSPFGNQALAGTVQVVTRNAGAERLSLSARAGSQGTWEGAATWSAGRAGLLASARAFGTDGYHAIPDTLRGAVDTPVAARGHGLFVKARPAPGWRLTLDGFRTDRDNGTPVQTNRVEGAGIALGWRSSTDATGLDVTSWIRRSRLESRFSAIDDDRNGETAVLEQEVPSVDAGMSILAWPRPGASVRISAGADVRRVSGRSEELVVIPDFRRAPGGRQLIGGGWVALRSGAAGPLALEASVRADAWSNRAHDDDTSRSASRLSPRIGLVWQPHRDWSVRAAGYGAFRAPTLNELYRQFRVGAVITAANDALEPEHLWGGEAGVSWSVDTGPASRFRLDVSVYSGRLENAIVNATTGVTPTLTFRERRNLGTARTSGLEVDGRLATGPWEMRVSGAWMSTAILGAESPELVGNRLPQVPTWRMTSVVEWGSGAGWTALLGLHATGRQYEDDLNLLALRAGATLDAAIEVPTSASTRITLHAQNLFDERLQVGRTPILALGPPRAVALSLAWTPGGDAGE